MPEPAELLDDEKEKFLAAKWGIPRSEARRMLYTLAENRSLGVEGNNADL